MTPEPKVGKFSFIGSVIRRLRRAQGISQAELGQLLGMHQAAVCRIEKGNQQVLLGQVFDLAHALRVSPGRLVFEIHREMGREE